MEERVFGKPYVTAPEFRASLADIYEFTFHTFGYAQAERYRDMIKKRIERLPIWPLSHPECRHLQTKSHMYRNIILDAHLIIYRVTKHRIEVLDIVHSASSVGKIRSTRSIRIS